MLYWAVLDWVGLGWAGLGWAGLGWAGLGWAGLAQALYLLNGSLHTTVDAKLDCAVLLHHVACMYGRLIYHDDAS